VTTLVDELQVDERSYAINGWAPPDPSTLLRSANPMTTCDPNASCQVSRVDIVGDESPLSDPIRLPDLFLNRPGLPEVRFA
jgi:hypothetical protein